VTESHLYRVGGATLVKRLVWGGGDEPEVRIDAWASINTPKDRKTGWGEQKTTYTVGRGEDARDFDTLDEFIAALPPDVREQAEKQRGTDDDP
jgi:hypothetical protein